MGGQDFLKTGGRLWEEEGHMILKIFVYMCTNQNINEGAGK